MTFRILVADKLAEEGIAYLRAQTDAEVDVKPGLSESELAALVGGYDGLIVRSEATVSAEVLRRAGRLKVVARAGVGVDNIDVDRATAAGVLVLNTAEASTLTTAEHTFALLLSLARHVGPAYVSMREGKWQRSAFNGAQLAGRTLGVIGFGRIGRAIAQRALAFDMNVVAYDPFVNEPTSMGGKVAMYGDVEAMLPQADVLTFHVPLNDRTHRLLDAHRLALCRDGVMVLNVSRGGVIDEDALIDALNRGKVLGAALDVFEQEPLPPDALLRSHPRVLLTPHLGASTVEAQQAVSRDAAEALLDYLRGRGIRGAVNVSGVRLEFNPIEACGVDLASRMAKLIDPMLTEGILGVRIEIASADLASVEATIERIVLIGLLQPHLDAPLNLVNVRHVAEGRGIEVTTVTRDQSAAGRPTINIEIGAGGRRDNRPHRIVGSVYHDMRPRVLEINGYRMDMVPSGCMVLIKNDDRPGCIGVVGATFGEAGVNIADMVISRRDETALMVLKLDTMPADAVLDALRGYNGIQRVALVRLPEEVMAGELAS